MGSCATVVDAPPLADGASITTDGPVVAALGGPGTGAAVRVWLGCPTDRAGAWAALPTPRDARSPRALRAFVAAAATGGPGGGAVPWRHLDLVAGGSRLRLVLMPGGGPWFDDALTWLPKVLGPDPTILVVGAGDRVEEVRSLARRHSTALVATAWPGDAGLVLPDGPFGELLWRLGDGAVATFSGDALTVRAVDAPVAASWTVTGGWVPGEPQPERTAGR